MNRQQKSQKKVHLKTNMQLWTFLIVPLLIFLFLFIIPNAKSIYLSFFEWDGMSPEKKFVGFKNFIRLFTQDPGFIVSLKNTLLYTVVVLIFQTTISLIVAAHIRENKGKSNGIYRTIIYLPYMISSVAIGFIWTFIYDPTLGLVNSVLKAIGFGDLCQPWLASGTMAIVCIAIVHIWFGVGQGMLLFLAGLQQIPNELYEAASVDGCTELQKFLRITLPMLKVTALTVTTLTIIGCFKSFDFVYVLTGGGADGSSSVLALQLYKEAFKYSKVGYSAAISVVLLVVVMSIYIIQTKVFKED